MLCLSDWLAFTDFEDSLTYFWEGIGVVDSLPVTENSWYSVTATSSDGCIDIDSVYIIAINCDDALPNVITANGDGLNDNFIIDEAPIFKNNKLQILNRWGNVIFEMESYDNSFNGGDCVDGVYFYYFIYDVSQPDGKQIQGFLHIIK
jgi:gliding motility-associated-like protein